MPTRFEAGWWACCAPIMPHIFCRVEISPYVLCPVALSAGSRDLASEADLILIYLFLL